MTISKGFLQKRTVFSTGLLTSGTILWITFSYILYAFFYLSREILRFLTADFGDQVLLVLDKNEAFIYNIFCSSLAVAISYGLALRFVLQNSVAGQSAKTRLLIRRTLNDQGFFTWAFLSWFSRLISILGICYITFPIQYDIYFLDEFPLLLILLPIVVFFSTWPKLSRITKGYAAKWATVSFGLFATMSLGFTFKSFLASEKIDTILLKKSIEFTYGLTVPRSQIHQMLPRRSLTTNVYVARDTIDPFQPIIFVKDVYIQTGLDSVDFKLNLERDKLSWLESSQMAINLHIDENIPMTFVEELKYHFRRDSLSIIQYSTGHKHSKYPTNYPLWKYSGIQQYLYPRFYPKLVEFLDSAEHLDFTKHRIRLPQSMMYRVNALEEYDRIEVYIGKQEVMVNGTVVSDDRLAEIVYKFTKKYSPDNVIIFNKDNQITFGRYIKYLDLVYSQIEKLKNEMSLELYQKPFDNWYWLPEFNVINSKYPRNVLEWTREEERLLGLMKKAGNTTVK
ncbi:hypothetical protein RT717_02425 [Imperialibacter roseus]|uniref:Uncharacterized protein n=1 Tax=Imperialibacter roseus TaxID=1324217 RepID=A0ABZ0IUV9_9BACT|nr:hypothetical protein [Imperialibacter roseus]WOK07476.1 hypothetical protein RT717_02425 [Imperialibacter roseus]